MKAVALLAAAGQGERLQADVPKALLQLSGKPLLRYAMDAIDACLELQAVVVAAPADRWREVVDLVNHSQKVIEVVEGGETRTGSIRKALEAVPAEFDAVACHDVARPFASPALFTAVLRALDDADAAIPTLPVHDTVKRIDGSAVAETLPRDGLALAQTPQAFRREVLEAAHRAAALEGFEGTDDAALVERAGYVVVVVPGELSNLKVTTARDLTVAAALADLRG
ncbi:MAG TPA: 2-C-methyl-D-erythritol 4-phosphate cytidylyltransferase [Actinomycetota bacterium]|nr:2-C-methyl-D-erythritol 4-phosphate cytidylyltransferase [Actinomycetota bacterium]